MKTITTNEDHMVWLAGAMATRDELARAGRTNDATNFARLAAWLESHADELGRITISTGHLRHKAKQTAPMLRANMNTLRAAGLLVTLPFKGVADRTVHQLTIPSTVGAAHAYA